MFLETSQVALDVGRVATCGAEIVEDFNVRLSCTPSGRREQEPKEESGGCREMKGDSDGPNPDDLVVDSVADSGSSSSNGSSGGSSSRSAVVVKLEFGTKRFSSGTRCNVCDKKAEGVMVYEEYKEDYDKPMTVAKPVCKNHREKLQGNKQFNWQNVDYKKF